jgi:hypothetical protein
MFYISSTCDGSPRSSGAALAAARPGGPPPTPPRISSDATDRMRGRCANQSYRRRRNHQPRTNCLPRNNHTPPRESALAPATAPKPTKTKPHGSGLPGGGLEGTFGAAPVGVSVAVGASIGVAVGSGVAVAVGRGVAVGCRTGVGVGGGVFVGVGPGTTLNRLEPCALMTVPSA